MTTEPPSNGRYRLIRPARYFFVMGLLDSTHSQYEVILRYAPSLKDITTFEKIFFYRLELNLIA